MSVLKPCPFCGYAPVRRIRKSPDGFQCQVMCPNCRATQTGILYVTREYALQSAVSNWNSRVTLGEGS